MPYAPAATAEALRALIRFYTTGDDADRVAYDIAWVRDDASPVDTVNGFVEVYLDPRGAKGAWEGLVSYVNREQDAAHRDHRGARPVVRGSHAVGAGITASRK